MNAILKAKRCRVCREPFTPRNSLTVVCSPRCALEHGRRRAETRERQRERQRRADKERLKTIPQLTREAQQAFNAWIRWRDRNQPCICCGRMADDSNLITGSRWDAGHYRSTGASPHLRFNEDNCHRQRVICNRHGSGRAVDYRIGLIRRIGLERVEALERDNSPRKYTADELRAIRDDYRRRLREAKKGAK